MKMKRFRIIEYSQCLIDTRIWRSYKEQNNIRSIYKNYQLYRYISNKINTEECKRTYCSPSTLYVFHVGGSRYFTRGIDDRTTRIKAFHATKQKAKIPEDFTDCSNFDTRYNVEMSIGLKRMWKDSEKIRFPACYSREKPRLTKSANEVSPNTWIYEHGGEYRERLCAALRRTRNCRFLWEENFFLIKTICY